MSIEFDKEQPGKTNLDHVREMNADEIGAFIKKVGNLNVEDALCYICPACQFCMNEHVAENGADSDEPPDCKNFAKWLNQPFEGDK